MNDFLEFIITNKRLIIDLVLVIISVVFFILRKKPIKFINTRLQEMLEWLPGFVIRAENTGLKGDDKVVFVLRAMYDFFEPTHGITYEQFLSMYEKYIVMHLEAILATPQKKEK